MIPPLHQIGKPKVMLSIFRRSKGPRYFVPAIAVGNKPQLEQKRPCQGHGSKIGKRLRKNLEQNRPACPENWTFRWLHEWVWQHVCLQICICWVHKIMLFFPWEGITYSQYDKMIYCHSVTWSAMSNLRSLQIQWDMICLHVFCVTVRRYSLRSSTCNHIAFGHLEIHVVNGFSARPKPHKHATKWNSNTNKMASRL